MGIDRIFQHNQTLINSISDLINQGEIRSPRNKSIRGGTLTLSFKDNQTALKHLQAEKVFCDLRSEGIRFSPHIYNSTSDLDHLVESINRIKE